MYWVLHLLILFFSLVTNWKFSKSSKKGKEKLQKSYTEWLKHPILLKVLSFPWKVRWTILIPEACQILKVEDEKSLWKELMHLWERFFDFYALRKKKKSLIWSDYAGYILMTTHKKSKKIPLQNTPPN